MTKHPTIRRKHPSDRRRGTKHRHFPWRLPVKLWTPVNHPISNEGARVAFDLYMEQRRSTAHVKLPLHMIPGLARWVLWGIPPGNFLRQLLLNRFVNAVAAADDYNREHLIPWAMFLYNDLPSDCWGSEAAISAWSQKGGELGRCALCGVPMNQPGQPETDRCGELSACTACVSKHVTKDVEAA